VSNFLVFKEKRDKSSIGLERKSDKTFCPAFSLTVSYMSNLRAGAYLSLTLSVFLIVASGIFLLDEDTLLNTVFLAAGIVLGF
jgi:hypothetical protein